MQTESFECDCLSSCRLKAFSDNFPVKVQDCLHPVQTESSVCDHFPVKVQGCARLMQAESFKCGHVFL